MISLLTFLQDISLRGLRDFHDYFSARHIFRSDAEYHEMIVQAANTRFAQLSWETRALAEVEAVHEDINSCRTEVLDMFYGPLDGPSS